MELIAQTKHSLETKCKRYNEIIVTNPIAQELAFTHTHIVYVYTYPYMYTHPVISRDTPAEEALGGEMGGETNKVLNEAIQNTRRSQQILDETQNY